MQLFAQRQPSGRRNLFGRRLLIALAVVSAVFAGCASPGPPLPPTLNLAEIPSARTLRAERIGDAVRISFTVPQRTTDRLLIKGPMQAEICREPAGPPGPATQNLSPSPGRAGGGPDRPSSGRPCAPVVATAAVKPGAAGEALDTLPPDLIAGPPRLLLYRVQFRNSAGRTAGASAAVPAAAGEAPPALADLHAHTAKAGVILEWSPESGVRSDAVELERTAVSQTPTTMRRPPATGSAGNLLAPPGTPAKIKLAAGSPSATDPGGTIDGDVAFGETYQYSASRVRTVIIGGYSLELRSSPSAPVTVAVKDVFPPDAPQALVAAPGLSGPQNAPTPAIDLSWEPNPEPRIAGYRVYRRDAAATGWQCISGADPVPAAAYRDTAVTPGVRYAYRVTAVGLNGLESAPGNIVEEIAGEP